MKWFYSLKNCCCEQHHGLSKERSHSNRCSLLWCLWPLVLWQHMLTSHLGPVLGVWMPAFFPLKELLSNIQNLPSASPLQHRVTICGVEDKCYVSEKKWTKKLYYVAVALQKKNNIYFFFVLFFFLQCRFSEMTAPWVKQLSNHAGAQSPCACGWARTLRSVVWLPGRVDYERPSEMWPLCKTIFFIKPTFARQRYAAFFLPRFVIFWPLYFLSFHLHTFIHIQEERGDLCPGAPVWAGSQSAPRSANQENPATVISPSSLAVSQYLSPSFTHARLFLFLFFCHFPALFLQLIWQIHTLRLIDQWKQKVNSRRKARVYNPKQASQWHKSAD